MSHDRDARRGLKPEKKIFAWRFQFYYIQPALRYKTRVVSMLFVFTYKEFKRQKNSIVRLKRLKSFLSPCFERTAY